MAKAEYRSAIRSRKLIHAALADLLQEKPIEKITVTDIVARAEINRGTFYAHYRDVPDVVNHLIHQTLSAIQKALTEQGATEDITHALLCEVQHILEEDLFLYKKILTSSAASIMQEQLVSLVMEFMLEHKDFFFSGSQEQYELLIRFCAGGLSNLYRDWFSGKICCSLSELTQAGEMLIYRIIGEDFVPEIV